jgi:hypothetical protein
LLRYIFALHFARGLIQNFWSTIRATLLLGSAGLPRAGVDIRVINGKDEFTVSAHAK